MTDYCMRIRSCFAQAIFRSAIDHRSSMDSFTPEETRRREEKRKRDARWRWGFLLDRYLERPPWFFVPFIDKQIRVIECRLLAALAIDVDSQINSIEDRMHWVLDE